MTVQMILILVYSDQGLIIGEEAVSKLLSYLKTFSWRNLLFGVKSDDVVGIHPAGILVPKLLFTQESPVHACYGDISVRIRPRNGDEALLNLVIPQYIADDIPHP